MTVFCKITYMRLFKRFNGYWYVEFERGKCKSLRTKDKKIAERLFKELQKEALKGKLILLEKQEKILLKELIEEYLAWSKETKAKATYDKEKWIFQRFLETVGNKPVRLITVRDCETYLVTQKQLGRKEDGINIDYRHLKALFNKAKEWGYIKENPWTRVKPLKGVKTPPKFLSVDEMKRVLEYLEAKDPLFAKYVKFCLETGCRRNEALYLTWNDVNFKTKQILIKGKGNKIRIIPISKDLSALLKSIPKQGSRLFFWAPDTVSHKWNKAMKALGLRYRFHDIRHTTASWLAMKGIPLQMIQALLGHSDIRITQIYAHLRPDVLESLLEEISSVLQRSQNTVTTPVKP